MDQKQLQYQILIINISIFQSSQQMDTIFTRFHFNEKKLQVKKQQHASTYYDAIL